MIVDAGGLPVATGGVIRQGRLLRVAGALVAAEDLPRLERAGIRTYVDLRGAVEDRSLLAQWAQGAGVDYRWLPIDVARADDLVRAVRDASDAAAAAHEMQGFYRHIVDVHGRELAAAVGAIAEGTPVAFGCTAGKDRTGLVAALLQTVVGVPEGDVVRSYVDSAPEVERLRAALHEKFGMAEELFARPGVAVLLGVEETTMRATLAHIRARHGSVERYLVANGLPAGAIDALRTDLVMVAAHDAA